MFLYDTKLTDHCRVELVIERALEYPSCKLDTPEKIFNMMNELFGLNRASEENVFLLALTSKCDVIGLFHISRGTAAASLVSPREVFMKALLCGAVSVVLVHNHPSGDAEPSAQDFSITKCIYEAGELLHVSLLDHVIVGNKDWFSFRENGVLQKTGEKQ